MDADHILLSLLKCLAFFKMVEWVGFFSTGNKQKPEVQLINLYWMVSVANSKGKNELGVNISDPLRFIATSFGVLPL